jgi:hypothetical protein
MTPYEQTDAMLSERLKAMLLYVSQGATDDDLNAAGYTPEEIATIPKQEAIPFTPREGDTLTEYTPTIREDIRNTVADTAESLGASKGYAYQLGEGVAGSDDQMGLLDITPVGIAMGLQEGTRQFQRGYNSGSKTDMAMGAVNAGLSVVEAIPGAALVTKGLGKVVKGAGSRISKVFSASSKPDIAFQKAILDDTEFEPLDEVTLFPVSKPYVPPANFSSDITLTPEEGLASIKSYILDDVKNYDPTSWTGSQAQSKKKILDSFKDEELFSLAQELPHHQDPKYKDFLENNIIPAAKYLGVSKNDFISLVKELAGYYPPKRDSRLDSLTETNLPQKAQIGVRAGTGPTRPSDKKAEVLGFKDTVYHTSLSPDEFTEFDLTKSKGPDKTSQDLLGVHVGTARAAAERNFYVTEGLSAGDFAGKTMELRARTTDPLTKEEASKMFNKKPEELFDEPTGPFTEFDVNVLIRRYGELLFPKNALLPNDANEISAINLRRELAREGFTHIPYINDVEDPGSTSLIMLIDRPKGSPAVLRDVRAQFDPEKITDPDLRFAEGGMVEEEQMNRLMQEGGMASDGMSQEPVTGNEIPPGALASEVRDDVDAKLSGGEYVVPADVLRYYGVRFFEDLRAQAKQGMMEMESAGRIGGVSVDAQGVPMQDQDEELTPEEEQMLAQAMSATSGMAEGGLAFDRTQFTMPDYSNAGTGGAIESRTYFNPITGEKRTISFMGGTALGSIPADFVPWSQALQDTYNNTKPQTTEDTGSSDNSDSSDSDNDPTSSSYNYTAWADKNYDSITSNPYQFGMDALDDTKGQGAANLFGLAGGLLPLALSGGNRIQNVAEANASLLEMEAQGLSGTEEYKTLTNKVKDYVSTLSPVERGLVNSDLAATGVKYRQSLNDKKGTVTPSTPAASPVKQSGGSSSNNSGDGDSSVTSTIKPTTPLKNTGSSITGTSLSTTTPRPTPTRTVQTPSGPQQVTPRPVPTRTVQTPSGPQQVTITPQGGRAGFASGGLVMKPQKTNPKTKGLGGKL